MNKTELSSKKDIATAYQNALYQIASWLVRPDSEHTVEAITDYVCRFLANDLNFEVVSIFLNTDNRLFRRAIWPNREDYPEEIYDNESEKVSLENSVFNSGVSVRVQNALRSYQVNHRITKEFARILGHNLNHVCVIPIKSTQKDSLGVLRIINKLDSKSSVSLDGFSDDEIKALESISSIVGIAIENARYIKRDKLLDDLQLGINSIHDEDQRVKKILKVALHYFGCFQSTILLFEDKGLFGYILDKEISDYAESIQGLSVLTPDDYPLIPLKDYQAVEELKETTLPVFISDIETDSKASPLVKDLYKVQKIPSALLIPLIIQERVIGVLNIEWYFKKKDLTEDSFTQARLMGLLASEAIERIQFPGKLDEARQEGRRVEREQYSVLLHDAMNMQHRILLDLEMLEATLVQRRPIQQKQIKEIYSRARYTHQTLKNILGDLRSEVFAERGLAAAIKEYIGNSSRPDQIKFDERGYDSKIRRQITIAKEGALLYIAREFVTNAIKHGIHQRPEGRIEVTLSCDEGQVQLIVEDDGRGANTFPQFMDISPDKGFGMYFVKTWATQIGAILNFHTSELGGLKAVVYLPLH